MAARAEANTQAVPQVESSRAAAPATQSVPQATPPTPAAAPSAAVPPAAAAPSGIVGGPEDSELVRRRWAEVLGTLERRRVTWALVSANSQVAGVEAGVLTLAFESIAFAERFRSGQHAENVSLAVRETLGLQVRVDATVGPASAVAGAPVNPSPASAATTPARTSRPAATEPPPPTEEPPDEHDISDDDAPAPAAQLSGADVIASMLGGTIVDD